MIDAALKPNARYAIDAMREAIGALKALGREGDRSSEIIRRLEIGIEKIGGQQECSHDYSEGRLLPDGGVSARCKKCGHCARTQR